MFEVQELGNERKSLCGNTTGGRWKYLQRTQVGVGEGNSTPLQYACLENPMDGGAWEAAVHGVAKSWTRLSNFTFMH